MASVPAADVAGDKKEVISSAPISGISVLRHLHISEKSSLGNKIDQYTFIVTPNATKSEIAKEVENRYKVSVLAVRVNKRKGKSRRIGRYIGKTADIKKAVVLLKKGQSIAGA